MQITTKGDTCKRYLRKPPDMKVYTFTINNYLACFPPDRSGQPVAPLSEDKVKKIIYHAMPNIWKKKIMKQAYNYLDGFIYSMEEFFET